MIRTLLPLVEGQSEVVGLPILLRRLLSHLGRFDIAVAEPFRIARTRIRDGREVERAIVQGLRSRGGICGVVVVIDADDDHPLDLENTVRAHCRKATSLPVAVTAANRELEAWFLGAKESLRGVRSIRANAANPPDPESIRGAKERLSSNMEGNQRYSEVDDQPAFAERFDLPMALERCPSLQRLAAELEALLSILSSTSP